MNTVLIKAYKEPKISRREVLRYAGAKESAECSDLVESAIAEASGIFTYRVAFCECGISINGDLVDFGSFSVKSAHLAKNLSGCTDAIIFGATVGLSIDRLVAKYSSRTPSRALMLNALGAERIEALCDAFCEDICAELDVKPRPRFSPGYGDLPLGTQRDIFTLLDLPKKLGITLTDTLLMSPTKSVTAIMGIEK